MYLHPTQFLVGREGSGWNRLNPILLQTSERREVERRGEEDIVLFKQTIEFSMLTELSNHLWPLVIGLIILVEIYSPAVISPGMLES